MRHTQTFTLSLLLVLAAITSTAFAADPGIPFPQSSEISDQKPGSILFYNFYTSGAGFSDSHDTRINITNTNSALKTIVHLFFVDGATCSVADSFLCLTANQTASFLTSDLDPGISGYIIAVALEESGCPHSFNFLIGDAYFKSEVNILTAAPKAAVIRRRAGNLAAEACAAKYGSPLFGCDPNSPTTAIPFDRSPTGYDLLPSVLAVSNIPSRADGNSTLLILNRIGGNLTTSSSAIGSIFGILYDDQENSSSFTFISGACQVQASLSNTFPRTIPRLDQIIPPGRSGWMKLWAPSDAGLLGAVINFNPNADADENSFIGAQNLHKLRFTSSVTLIVPIVPPSC